MAGLTVTTHVSRYPAAEIWETSKWYANVHFACGDENWHVKDRMYNTVQEAVIRAEAIAHKIPDAAFTGIETFAGIDNDKIRRGQV